MSLTDEPREAPADPTDTGQDSEPPQVPTKARLHWPIVEALRVMGDASPDEIADHVAEVMGLTAEQLTPMIRSGSETKFRHRIRWALVELKHMGVLHYPSRGRRALTSLGLEVDEDRIKELRAEYEASKSSSDTKEIADPHQTDAPTAWLIRAGGRGELAESFIKNGIVAVGFGQLGDLSEVSSRDEILELVKRDWPESNDGQARARANQLWALLSQVHRDDVIVMPSMNNSGFALGTVTEEYWYRHDAADTRCHAVSVDWKPDEVPRAAVRQDLLKALGLRPTINLIRSDDHARRIQQLRETGQDPGPRSALDLPDLVELVEQFYRETGYPSEDHERQERLRQEWAEKLSVENVTSLSREDLTAYTNHAVDYGEYVNPVGGVMQWISDLDDVQYDGLRESIRDLCWGEDELSTRIDRLLGWYGGSRGDTGTKGFAQGNVSATLAICHPGRFLPVFSQEGVWGRVHMLRKLGLPEPEGATFGQRVVDANDRLRQHLAPHFDEDPLAIATFLYWLREDENGDEPDDGIPDLSTLVEQFRAETDYPTEAHDEQERLRAEWAEKLAPENIAQFSRLDLTGVASHGTRNRARYVYPYVRGVMQWIRRLDEDEYSRLLDSIEYLCWGEDEAWVRYDQLTDRRSDRRVRGLGDSTAIRLLAITHPKDFLPIGPHPGLWSRYTLLRRLGLPAPQGSSHGQRVVDGNNRLLQFLAPYFGDDTLEMGAFLEWLVRQNQPKAEPSVQGVDLSELAAELLIDDVDFLEDIVELLQDKGQVILYGPPGTGKTYLARELAKELAPDEACRVLVQFHPSTSYEDFFEGYRPAETDEDGGIRYELMPGPLARMAEQASKAPDKQHVMIIDEINRGNLPRVLGELLFLLEYRDEKVQTLYRPEEPFELPENLWFIGTMNTADRSIALVDAALRRRFHFVPFFPDSGPIAGLLARWLEQEEEPTWVGDLVDKVNAELADVLQGSHLLLGPSHFMKEYGSSPNEQRQRLRRIWKYNIEPFIEDQFFGDPEQINRFRFGSIVSRHRAIIERDRLSILAGGEELDQGPEASGSSEAQSSSERSRSRGATTPAWKDQFQGTPTAPTDHDELWKWRASNFPRRTEGRGEFQIYEIRSLACRWVEFALNAGVDPGRHDSQLVEDLLSPHGYSQRSLTAYRRHLREWFETDHDSAG